SRGFTGFKVFRYDGNLYFACAEHFRESVYSCTGVDPRRLASQRLNLSLGLAKIEPTCSQSVLGDVGLISQHEADDKPSNLSTPLPSAHELPSSSYSSKDMSDTNNGKISFYPNVTVAEVSQDIVPTTFSLVNYRPESFDTPSMAAGDSEIINSLCLGDSRSSVVPEQTDHSKDI
ncbi:unnamed protein product, partial [Protopolystoma xenopodis]